MPLMRICNAMFRMPFAASSEMTQNRDVIRGTLLIVNFVEIIPIIGLSRCTLINTSARSQRVQAMQVEGIFHLADTIDVLRQIPAL